MTNTTASTPVPIRRRAVGLLVAALAATTTAGLAGGTPAEAATGYSIGGTGGDGVALRSAPAANARITPLIVLRDGTPISIVCQAWSGDAVGPRANHVFNRISYPGRAEAWVPDAYVAGTAPANQFTPGLPRCGSAPAGNPTASPAAERAISWMRARLGSRALDGQCLAAVYQAYLAGGRDITAGLPWAASHGSAYSYWTVARNKHVGDRNAPRGALVFFRSGGGAAPGHVAISLGGGQMITTYDGRTPGIHIMPVSGYDPSRYLGWAGV